MPLKSYSLLPGCYVLLLAGIMELAQGRRARQPIMFRDIALVGMATHRLSRLISKDKVMRPLRAPFTDLKGSAGEGELEEEAKGRGIRRAIGDLLTCRFCTAPWAAASLVIGFLLAPKATRLLSSLLASVTVADFLHHAYNATEDLNGQGEGRSRRGEKDGAKS